MADSENIQSNSAIRLGLRENLPQFSLLVLVNAFVGGMVGLERTVVPLIGSEEFKIASATVVASFIISFGITKALTNLISGQLADNFGRKRVLVLGWIVGLPVPFMIIWAPSWNWIVAANVLLGVNQGLAWSMTVIMKIDLVGPKSRGLAVGLNEFAGYLAVGATAFVTGYIAAATHTLRPDPFYLGIGYAVLGLALSVLAIRDTSEHVRLEAGKQPKVAPVGFRKVFTRTSFRDPDLFAACQAGLVNNLNDGMSWAIFPIFFAAHGLGVEYIGVLKAVYPTVWGVLQTVTGPLSDRWGRKESDRLGDVGAGGRPLRYGCGESILGGGWREACCSGSARRWSTRHYSLPFRTPRIQLGVRAPLASIASGATWATPWAHCLLA